MSDTSGVALGTALTDQSHLVDVNTFFEFSLPSEAYTVLRCATPAKTFLMHRTRAWPRTTGRAHAPFPLQVAKGRRPQYVTDPTTSGILIPSHLSMKVLIVVRQRNRSVRPVGLVATLNGKCSAPRSTTAYSLRRPIQPSFGTVQGCDNV